jgi:hypothetical protein
MSRFIDEADRSQGTLLPETIDVTSLRRTRFG